jgi:Cytochrome c/c1 heme lyase
MGSAQSKPKLNSEAMNPAPVVVVEAEKPKNESQEEPGTGCPMRRADGSYAYDWRALFRQHPHGKDGTKPLSKDDLTQSSDGSLRPKDGCPVKHDRPPQTGGCPVKEYNVYSQPIDPTNQMPAVANQLPAPGQKEELSTNRVSSSIAKVGHFEL